MSPIKIIIPESSNDNYLRNLVDLITIFKNLASNSYNIYELYVSYPCASTELICTIKDKSIEFSQFAKSNLEYVEIIEHYDN